MKYIIPLSNGGCIAHCSECLLEVACWRGGSEDFTARTKKAKKLLVKLQTPRIIKEI